MKLRIRGVTAGAFLLAAAVLAGCDGTHRGEPVRHLYDFGPADGPLGTEHVRIGPETLYDPATGVGWIKPPDAAFHVRARAFHDELTVDGVTAAGPLVFRIDARPGDYILSVTLGGGDEEVRGVRIEAGGVRLVTNSPWFRIPFRTAAFPVTVDGDGLEVTLTPDTSQLILGFERQLVGREILYAPRSRAVALHAIALRPVSRDAQPGGSLGGISPDTSELRQARARWEREIASGSAAAGAWLDASRRYLRALEMYDSGWWSHSAARTGMNFFTRLWYAADLLQPLLADVRAPLYGGATYLAGKIHYWLSLEQHEAFTKGEAERLFARAARIAPADSTLRMYRGERIRTAAPCGTAPRGAPAWAVRHREAMCLVLAVVHWWVRERQAPNGELGGGYGDDVEFAESWLPAVAVADDSLARLGLLRIADGLWNSGLLRRGFLAEVQDIEHSAEYFSESHPFLVLLQYGDPRYVERCMISMQGFRDVWTAVNSRGHRHFRSVYVGADSVVTRPPFGVDVAMSARAAVGGLWLLWYNRDPALLALFEEWGRAWAEDAWRTGKGKPAGILPPAVRFDTDEPGGYSQTWYDPGLGWPYYAWESLGHVAEMYSHLTSLFVMTGDTTFVAPLRQTLRLALQEDEGADAAPRGSPPWVRRVLRRHGPELAPAAAQAYQHDPDPVYRRFLERHGDHAARFRLTGDTTALLEGYDRIIEGLSSNHPLRTREVKFTDRIFMDGVNHLFTAGTGGSGYLKAFPTAAVTWQGTGPDVAVLVAGWDSTSLEARIYNFGPPREIAARLWALSPGVYEVVRMEGGRESRASFDLAERGARLRLTLPSQVPLVLLLRRTVPSGVPFALPDLAFAPGELRLSGGRLEAVVHNIGGAAAADVRVEFLVDGSAAGTARFDRLPAPRALVPSTVRASVRWEAAAGAIMVRVSCAGPEITLDNNSIEAGPPGPAPAER